MNHSFPTITIIIATYNSSKLLPRTLDALANQTYPSDHMEIMIIDGGSTDKTREIASDYNCMVIDNPYKDPVNAKLIGYNAANGRYVMVLDHDEVLINPDSICIRVNALMEHPECKVALCSGYKRPANYPGLNQYISEFGDPFSLFVYHISKDYNYALSGYLKHGELLDIKDINSTDLETNSKYDIIQITDPDNLIIELCCLATIIDKEFFAENSCFQNNPSDMVHLFYVMIGKGYDWIIVSRFDPLEHYSSDSIRAYLPKLKWRIINNIHIADRANQGFLGRQKSRKIKLLTFLFPIYSLSLILPICESVYLALTRRNCAYLLHPFLCIYVTLYIIWQYTRKILGIPPTQRTYDGKDIEFHK